MAQLGQARLHGESVRSLGQNDFENINDTLVKVSSLQKKEGEDQRDHKRVDQQNLLHVEAPFSSDQQTNEGTA